MSQKITQIVSLSASAFFSIITSALETYKISAQNHPNEVHVPVETYGNLWGYQSRTQRGESVLHVVLADTDISAERKPDQVTPIEYAFDLKSDFVDHFFQSLNI